MLPDLTNGLFELLGACLILLNVRRLLRDRMTRGIDWRVTGFFTAWGYWNLFYYPSLGQWWSFLGGVVMVSVNTVWIILAIRFRKA